VKYHVRGKPRCSQTDGYVITRLLHFRPTSDPGPSLSRLKLKVFFCELYDAPVNSHNVFLYERVVFGLLPAYDEWVETFKLCSKLGEDVLD